MRAWLFHWLPLPFTQIIIQVCLQHQQNLAEHTVEEKMKSCKGKKKTENSEVI